MYLAVIILVSLTAGILYSVWAGRKERREFLLSVDRSFGRKNRRNGALDSIEEYYLNCQDQRGWAVDSQTWKDLELDQVFLGADACLTSAGEEYLYACLHYVEPDGIVAEKREKLIHWLETQEKYRVEVRRILAEVGKREYNGLSKLFFLEEYRKIGDAWAFRALGALPFAALLLFPFFWEFAFWLLVCSFLLNSVLYYSLKKKIEPELYALSYLSDVLWGCSRLSKKYAGKQEAFTKLSEYSREYRRLYKRLFRVMRGCRGGLDFLSDYISIITLSELSNYCEAMKLISSQRERFQELLTAFCEIDLAAGILSYRRSLKVYCKPEFSTESKLVFHNLVHPLLEDPVGYDAVIDRNSIITGANATGKSTFLKTVAVNCLLAQTLNTCLGEDLLMRRSEVIAVLSASDSIRKGESLYMAEMAALKRIIGHSREHPTLCFLDEMLRGTNTGERVAVSIAYLDYLRSLDTLSLTATHDLELAEALDDTFSNFHFSESLAEGLPLFSYQLISGICRSRNAVALLARSGFPSAVCGKALTILEELERKPRFG